MYKQQAFGRTTGGLCRAAPETPKAPKGGLTPPAFVKSAHQIGNSLSFRTSTPCQSHIQTRLIQNG